MGKSAGGGPERRVDRADPATSAEAFVHVFNEVHTELVSTLHYLLGNRDDAQDAAQETFLKCWRSREDLDVVQNMRAWIFRIGLNAAKDLQRNAWRRRVRPLGEQVALRPSDQPSPPESALERESVELLRSALMNLRPEEKEVFLLRQNADLTYEEIADLRRSPVGTVKTQMRSALQKLKHVLQQKQTTDVHV
jgi:RNA polymerase sigma-70 factor (ECF subfamily)